MEGKKRRWDPEITVAELVIENHKAKHGKWDETEG